MKVRKRSELMPQGSARVIVDSLAAKREYHSNMDLLIDAQHSWDALRSFRKDRERCLRFCYGDQWSDYVDVDGKAITEAEHIRMQGCVPLQNNLIRRLVRTLLGVYRKQGKEPLCVANDVRKKGVGEIMTAILKVNMKNNNKEEIDSRVFEDFLIGGLAVEKESYGFRNGVEDCYTDVINPYYFFFDTNTSDLRNWDCRLVGEIHDLNFEDVLATYAKSEADAIALKDIYNRCSDLKYMQSFVGDRTQHTKLSNIDFYVPHEANMCRVIEVWTLEHRPRLFCHDVEKGEVFKVMPNQRAEIEAINQARINEGVAMGMDVNDIALIETEWRIDEYWYVRHFAPTGEILYEGESPYKSNGQPYTWKPYPFTNGEIHSVVNDVIDQQKYVNRYITLNDKIIRTSSKGVLLYPESLLPDGWTMQDVANEWARPDGFIPFNDRNGTNQSRPMQMYGNAGNIGTTEMLQLQMNLMEEISGVQGVLQGKQGYSGQSASLYIQQTQNASNAVLDVLDSFNAFLLECAKKKLNNIQEFYNDDRKVKIVGQRDDAIYKATEMCDIKFDLTIIDGENTPAAKASSNDFLNYLFQVGAIDKELLLQYSPQPISSALLEAIKSREAEMQAQQEQMAQAQGGAIPQEQGGELPSMPQATQPVNPMEGEIPTPQRMENGGAV